ncbi:CobW family GTP-binding protein [Taklimakanibacter lacteus]|uniref:CobW family GTP-binding protein n=1 Tax=Taklimakanibacter lacteus TaxID=2268456 RepID=UPI000E664B11
MKSLSPVPQHPIPVTLLTGFLGAGKTTLVNRMLREAGGLRLAVLVNDFGAVNIDTELIEGTADEVIALSNGCICCSLTGGLLAAVSGVLRRPEPPDAIVIEGSGVSEPLEVVRALSDPELQRYAPLDAVVTIVDAGGIAHLDGDALGLALRQISAADLVLMNKVDLADEAAIRIAESRVAALAPGARIIRCVNAEVPLAVLLGLAGGKQPGASSVPPSAREAFETVTIERQQPIPTQRLHDLLSSLPERVYRVKGVLQLAERAEARCILQVTGKRATITIGEPWNGRQPRSQIVFIAAKGTLDRSLIESLLDNESVIKIGPEAMVA